MFTIDSFFECKYGGSLNHKERHGSRQRVGLSLSLYKMEGALTNMLSREIRILQPSLVLQRFLLQNIWNMEDKANTSQPVITFDMLISYLKQEEYVKIPPNSSEELVNVSTIEFHDPYNVEPDLSAEVHNIYMSETSSVFSV